ncbi:MAG: flagellar hook-length control protein FliK [Fusobacteriaceae bacterium]|nr:flagellar hook-length control protein FliK [Fusobacteriaceae bacterium]MBN2839118.1 flagellar hook-length control protein FliK [Fusobacteriaceae bacterium]
MMPNFNNLAATITVSEKGETPAKGSKKVIGKTSDFSGIFGKTKVQKEKKKQNLTEKVPLHGMGIQAFQIRTEEAKNLKAGNFSSVSKVAKPTVQMDNSKANNVLNAGTLEKGKENLQNLNLSTKNLKTAEDFGKRIESMNPEISNLKGKENIPNSSSKSQAIIGKNSTLKNAENYQVQKNQKGLVKEVPALNNKVENISFQKNQIGKLKSENELGIKSKIEAKDNLKFAFSDNKVVAEGKEKQGNENSKLVTSLSSYGLKKMTENPKTDEMLKNSLTILKKSELGEENESKEVNGNSTLSHFQDFQSKLALEENVLKANNYENNLNNYDAVMQQVENGIKINYNNQLKEMKIKLQPEELGEVEVKMTIENNIMKAQFVVENQKVKEILESRFDSLRNALENKGFQGAEINVFVSTGGHKETRKPFVYEKKGISKDEKINYSSKLEALDNNSKIKETKSDSRVDIVI